MSPHVRPSVGWSAVLSAIISTTKVKLSFIFHSEHFFLARYVTLKNSAWNKALLGAIKECEVFRHFAFKNFKGLNEKYG